MHKMTGYITYDPKRNFGSDVKEKGWLTIEAPSFKPVAQYYMWFLNKEWWKTGSFNNQKIDYHLPSHPFHISVIRGEKLKKNAHLWGKRMNGKKVEFEYKFHPEPILNAQNGEGMFWIVKTFSKEYIELRKFFGLDYQRDGVIFSSHMTYARSFNIKPN